MAGTSNAPRWRLRLLVAAGAIAVLLGGGYAALVIAFPPERVAALVSDQVTTRTGRDFRIDGKLSWRVLPKIAVVADQVVFGNATWGSRKEMARVAHAAFELDPWPLLQGDVEVGSVELEGVELLLETDRHGVGNWVLSPPQPKDTARPSTPGESARSVELGSLRLRDVAIAYRDGASGSAQTLSLTRFDLDRNDSGNRIDAQWAIRKQNWRAKGELGRIDALRADAADWPFDLELTTDGARVAAKGRLLHGASPRAARLQLDAKVDRPGALSPWVETADSLPLPVELKATLAASSASVSANPLTVVLAGQTIAGHATWRSGKPWQFDASLKAGTIDLANARSAGAKGGAGSGASGGEAGPLFGDERLPLRELPDGRASVDLRIDQLQLPDLPPLSAVSANLRLDPGMLRAQPLTFGVAGGQVRGGVVLKPGAAPLLDVQADASGLSAEALARAAGSSHVGGGRVRLETALAMRGDTPRALAASANGRLLVTVKDMPLAEGALSIGPNLLPRLLQIVQPQRGAAKTTVVECAVARLAFNDGVALVDRSIAAETANLTLSASGRIDLRDQTLDLAIRPAARGVSGMDPTQLASVVVAKGPLRDPKLSIDAKAAANMALAIGAAAATNGLSVLGSNLFRQVSDPHPCVFAETGVVAKAPAGAPEAASPSGAKPSESAPDQLRKMLRGLFK